MPASIYTGDSGEIATAVYAWGVAHPTGFPVYMVLAKLFSYFLPWFEFAYRLNIFSALVSAVTAGILFLILQKFKINYLASIAISLAFAFGYTAWSHAGIIQVYGLTALFFALAILIFLHWLETKKAKWLYILVIVSGLGVGTHLSFLLFFPFAIAYYSFSRQSRPILKIKHLFFCFLVFLFFGFLVYSYIPWRAAANPELNWGNPSTTKNFINYITQRDYSDKIGTRSADSWLRMLGEFSKNISREYTWLGLIFVLAGAVIAFKKNPSNIAELTTGRGKPLFYAGLSVIFFNIMLLGNYGGSQDIFILWRYFLPSYIVTAVFMGFAFNKIFAEKKYAPAILLLPAIIFAAHFGELNRRDNFLVQNAARDIFNSAPQNAVLIIDGDTLIGSTMYEQMVLRKRKDIILISDKLFTHPWYREAKKKELEAYGKKYADNISYLIKDNPEIEFFAVTNANALLKINYDFYSWGLIYKILNKKEQIKSKDFIEKNEEFWKDYNFELLKDKRFEKDYFADEIVKIYTSDLNNLAAYLTNNNDVPGGIKYFKKSLEIRENKNALYNLAGIYNALGDAQKALEYKDRFDALK